MRYLLDLVMLIASLVALAAAGNLEIRKSAFSKRHAQARRELDSPGRRSLNNEVAVLGARDLEKRFEGVRITFYDAGLGACGRTNTNADFIVALNPYQYGSGGHCFDMITIIANGKTATAQIVDLCVGCPYGGLDFSRGLFDHFASQSLGTISGSWYFGSAPATTTTTHIPTTPTTTYIPTPTTTNTPTPTPTTTTTIRTLSSSSRTSVRSSLSSTSSAADPLQSNSPNATTSDGVLDQLNLAFVNLGAIVVVGRHNLD